MRKVYILILTLVTVFSLTTGAYAAELSVDTAAENVRVGDTFTITVKYTDDELDNVKADLEYDDEALNYISGGSNSGNGGVVKLDGYSSDAKTISFNVEFEALKSGTAEYKVETQECYNLDGKALNSPWQICKVEVAEGASGEADKKAESEEEKIPEAAEKEDNDSEAADVDTADTEDQEAAETADNQKGSNTRLLIAGSVITLILIAAFVFARIRRR